MAGSVGTEVFLLSGAAALFLGVGPAVSKRGLAMGGTWMQAVLLVLVTRTALFWVVLVGLGGSDPSPGARRSSRACSSSVASSPRGSAGSPSPSASTASGRA